MTTLAIDIGNSSWKIGLFRDQELMDATRIESDDVAAIQDLINESRPSRAVACSVVPRASERLRDVLLAQQIDLLEIRVDVELPFAMAYQSPDTLGADRIAAASGGVALYPEAELVVTIDAGTAVTAEVIHKGRFLGGAIAPGPSLLAQGMADGTAQLPLITPGPSERVIGTTTVECLTSGVSAAFVGGVRELITGIELELGDSPIVIATGGWGAWLAKALPGVRHEPHLVLLGLLRIADLNATRTE